MEDEEGGEEAAADAVAVLASKVWELRLELDNQDDLDDLLAHGAKRQTGQFVQVTIIDSCCPFFRRFFATVGKPFY